MTVSMERRYQGNINQGVFDAIRTEECVEIWSCDRPGACGWRGLHLHLIKGKKRGCETSLVCPECGHDTFESKYIPADKARRIYMEKPGER